MTTAIHAFKEREVVYAVPTEKKPATPEARAAESVRSPDGEDVPF